MATPRMPEHSRRGRTLALRAGQLLLTVAVTWFIVDRVGLGLQDLATLDPETWRPRWGVFSLSCAVLLAGYVLSAAIWGLMVAELGGPWLGLRAVVPIYILANLGRYVPGKLWQIAGLAVLAMRRGVPPAVSTAAAVLGQAVALGGAAMVGAAALLGPEGGLGPVSVVSLLVLGAILAVVLVPALQRRAVGLWFRLARREEPPAEPGGGTTLRWLVLYTLNWVVYAGAFHIMVVSLELPGSPLEVGSAFAAAYVLGYLAVFAPAGIGVRDGFLVLFLSPVMGAAAAGAVSIVARLWTTGVELVPAALLWGGHLVRARGPESEAT